MKISYNYLHKLIDFDYSPDDLGVLLTNTGLEVEGIEQTNKIEGGLEGLVVGEVKSCEQHPNADKLKCTKVDVGIESLLEIVCGAPNVAIGQKVIVALVGTTLYPKDGEPFTIKKSKIRGEVSEGMLCAEDEIGLGASHAGIMILDADLQVGTPIKDVLKIENDYCIEIGLTPNRADAASHFGVARDIKAVTGNAISFPDISGFEMGSEKSKIELVVENTAACPRFCGLEIRNVQVADSPDWLKNFLQTIGVNSINNLVDISNYICHFLGQPMHIFDADKIIGNKIIVKVPESNTSITTLDGIERKLSGSDLAICNTEKPMAIAGVFGGIESGVSSETKNVFLEVAYFNPDWIRKTATFHSLKTDASFRYERGTDPNMPSKAIQVAALLVKELAGGDFCDKLYDNYPYAIEDHKVDVKFNNIDRLLGKKLPREDIRQILCSLDIKIVTESEYGMQLSVPPFRVDVLREADIVEEILRIYGFDNIELSENMSADFLSGFPQVDPDSQKIRISEMLASNGFNEIQTLSIVKPAFNSAVNTPDSTVQLLNPLSEDLSEMRSTLLFSGLQSLAHNINRRNKDLKLFEFGRTYIKKVTEESTKYPEKQVLSIWISGNAQSESWQLKLKHVDFYSLKNIVALVLKSLRYDQFTTDLSESAMYEFGTDIKINSKQIGSFGKIKKEHLKLAEVRQDVFYAELDWDYLLKKYSAQIQAKEISRFPEVRRDLSLVIDKSISFDQIKNLAQKTERKLLQEINVFDVFEDAKLGENKKSYSISFILQDEYQTLQDKVIDKAMNRLIQSFENELGALIRK